MWIKISGNKHTFEICRKPATTDIIIHKNSCRPLSHKHAAFHSMIHRLLISIPFTEKAYSQELEIIKEIAVKNGIQKETHRPIVI